MLCKYLNTLFLFTLTSLVKVARSYDFTNIPIKEPNPMLKQHNLGLGDDTISTSNTTSQSQTQLQVETADEHSIFYNVSSLGLPDPFANYSTKISYDSKVDIANPHDKLNQKGSVLSVLNGTVFPMGSVGSIAAIGWEGGLNQTDFEIVNNGSDSTTEAEGVNAKGALSGIWLAFTSQDAITGGYTFNNDSLTTSNNVFYQNLTFLSNFTVRQDGTYSFKFSLSSLAMKDRDGKQVKLAPPTCTQEFDSKGDTRFAITCISAS